MKQVVESPPLSRLPLLVTGISGVAGFNAFLSLRSRYPGQVVGIRPHQTGRLTGDGIVALDAEDHAGLHDLFRRCRFRAGRPATLYFDEVRSCTYADDLTRVFERFLIGDEAGLYHLGGPRAMTLYQIGQIVNRVGGYNPRLLKGCPRIEAGPMPPRA